MFIVTEPERAWPLLKIRLRRASRPSRLTCQTFFKRDSVCHLGDRVCHAIQGEVMNYLSMTAKLTRVSRDPILALLSRSRERVVARALPRSHFSPELRQ